MISNRRQALKTAAAMGIGAHALATSAAARSGKAPGVRTLPQDGKLLFVIAATGGGSLMDCFLPVVKQAGTPGTLNAYDMAELDQSPLGFRCPKDIAYEVGSPVGPTYSMIDFLKRHEGDLAVVTQEATSVNHLVGSERALNGNNANQTRTLMEAVAQQHGQGQLFANVNMALGAYAAAGRDGNLPAYARPVSVGDAMLFPLSTHGSKGLLNVPGSELIARARQIRATLEQSSPFVRQFQASQELQRYLSFRNNISSIEAAKLIDRLMLIDEMRQGIPLSEYGLETSDELGALRDAFPSLGVDPFHSQAALGFLLAKYGMSSAVTFGISDSVLFTGPETSRRMDNLPLAFDWSHNNHRGAQNTMWRRILQVTDHLITMLKTTDYLGDPSLGKMWARSLVYVATEFGRSKNTQGSSSRGSGHDLNNGHVILSPLLRGGKVYGGIDGTTGLTFGFNPMTGAADKSKVMAEAHTYSLILQALGVPFSGRVAMDGLVR